MTIIEEATRDYTLVFKCSLCGHFVQNTKVFKAEIQIPI